MMRDPNISWSSSVLRRPLRSAWVVALRLLTACHDDPPAQDFADGSTGVGGLEEEQGADEGQASTTQGPGSTTGDDEPADGFPSPRLDVGAATAGDAVDPDEEQTCAGEVSVAQRKPLDMVLMVDTSGSMEEPAGISGATRWDTVRGAIDDFIAQPSSAGMGVGLQYFPRTQTGNSLACTSDEQCGAAGVCATGICDPFAFYGLPGYPCAGDLDCGGAACLSLGRCSYSGLTCLQGLGPDCPYTGDVCEAVDHGQCTGESSCDPTIYAQPAVAIGTLPAHRDALAASLNAEHPFGDTPTSAALRGALDYARTWASDRPDHATVVVLATDGEPTSCEPLDAFGLGEIAASGRLGTPSISTFVIGIVGVEGQDVLDRIAAEGGSEHAFIVDPQSPNLGGDFQDALDTIRGESIACSYQIPRPSGATQLDLSRVNVEYTPQGGATETIPYVGDPRDCDARGGWTYDIDPALGDPSSIEVCPQTCDAFAQGGSIEIRVGCETVRPVG